MVRKIRYKQKGEETKRDYLLTGQSSPSEKKTVTIMTLHISLIKKHASNSTDQKMPTISFGSPPAGLSISFKDKKWQNLPPCSTLVYFHSQILYVRLQLKVKLNELWTIFKVG